MFWISVIVQACQKFVAVFCNQFFFFVTHTVINFVHHTYSVIVTQFVAVAFEEVPVEIIKGTGVWTIFFGYVVAATFAVV